MRAINVFQKTLRVIDSIETEDQYFVCIRYIELASKKIRQLVQRGNKDIKQEAESLISEFTKLVEMKREIVGKNKEKKSLEAQLAGLYTTTI
jgi:hypothetical protein